MNFDISCTNEMKRFQKNINSCLIILFAIVACATATNAQQIEQRKIPRTIEALRKAILQVLDETGTPAAGIALVNKQGPLWVESLGKANIEKNINADEETMFRIGSTSKIFIALAILKLQEQGILNLKNKVRDLVPEIKFTNAWEDTNPILIEHLLEHTTGWGDLHLVEYQHPENKIVSLKEALDFHPHSRVSMWMPGTRMAYCNTGPNVAAYIVEKIAGQPYENYIQENFFSPLGMETMTYRLSEDYKKKGATLYKEEQPQDYWHLLMRASGSINASPKDMAKFMQFFVNRGKIDSIQLISENSIKRMETPSTTSGAKAGLKFGYGLGLYASPHHGFIYYKHGGGVIGGSSDFSYLPEYGVGYSVQINSDNAAGTIWKIAELIRDFQTQDLSQPKEPTAVFAPHHARTISGYYHEINPRTDPMGLPSLTATRIWTDHDTLYMQELALLGDIEKYVAKDDNLYQSVKTKRDELILTTDPLVGEVFELANVQSGTITLGSIPATFVFARILIGILWILSIIYAILLLPVWIFRFWKGKITGGANVYIRVWPLLPVVLLPIAFVLLFMGTKNVAEELAKPSVVSVSIMMVTLAFFIAAVFSFVMSILYRNKEIQRAVYFPAALLSTLHVVVAYYLLWHGVIGLRTWA